MLGKIHKEMNNFTFNIKTLKGHDELLNYMNSNIYGSIKLLFFSSSTFSVYAKMMIVFIITISGVFIASSFGVFGNASSSMYLLIITFALYLLTFTYIMHCKKFLISSILTSKSLIEKDEQ